MWLMAAAAAAQAGDPVVDPTQPPPGYGVHGGPGAEAPQAEPLHLQMIARSGTSRVAVLNGQRVKSGDTIRINGARVQILAVRDDALVLERAGQQQILPIAPRQAAIVTCSSRSQPGGCSNPAPGGAP